MRQNKKLVSLAVVFAMIMTMLSSMIVVNAAGASVYTEAEKTETGVTLKIGYKDMAEELEGFEIKVPIPTGFTATASDITLATLGGFSSANVDNGMIIITAAGANYATTLELATVNLTLAAAPTESVEYTFNVDSFLGTLATAKTDVSLADDTVAEEAGSVEYEVAVTGPRVYVSDTKVVDGKATITIGYKDMTEELEGFEIKVPIPAGFTATASDITLATLGGFSSANVDNNVIIITAAGANYATSLELATVVLTAADDYDVNTKFVVSEFLGTLATAKTDVSLADGSVKKESGKITTDSEPTPTPTPTPPAEDSKIKSVTLDATAKAAKAGDKVEFTVKVDGTGDTSVTATAKMGDTDVAVDVKGSVVTVTVPSDAAEGAKIELVVTAVADTTKSAKATITVIDPVIDIKPVEKTEVTMNGAKVKMFVPNITTVAGKDVATKFAADQTYRVVFDFTKKDGITTVGKAVTSITGAQVALLADGDAANDPEIFADALGAEVATIHFEDSTGKVIQ